MTYQQTLRTSGNVFSSVQSLVLTLTQTSVHLWYLKTCPRFYSIKRESYGSQEGSSFSKHAHTYYPQHIHIFNGMAQFYRCFIKNFASIMSPIARLLKNSKVFEWTRECQIAWEEIKNLVQALVLINPNQELEFHVHPCAYRLAQKPYLPRTQLVNLINRLCTPLDY